MKRFYALITMFIAVPLFAGVTYDIRSTSTSVQSASLSGTVAVEGPNVRMDVKQGDNFIFKDNTFVLSNDGGRNLSVYDPAAKTYYDMNLTDLAGNSAGLLGSLGGSVKFTNPKVSVRDLGDGETIAGYPTHHAAVDASYDVNIDIMGNQMTTHMTMTTESWTTDRLSADFINFVQMKNMHTGFGDLDKLIDAQSSAMKGRFPLKQVTTIHIQQGTNDMSSTSTSEVSNVRQKTIEKAMFAQPSGYTKVDDPMTRMMKNIK